jgi:hypothetical protein
MSMQTFFEAEWDRPTGTYAVANNERYELFEPLKLFSPPLLSHNRPRQSPKKNKMEHSKPPPIMGLEPSTTVGTDERDLWNASKDVETSYEDFPVPSSSVRFYPTPTNEDRYFDLVIPPQEDVLNDIVYILHLQS